MAAAATLNFTRLLNNRVWFTDANAFNAWMEDITVPISGANLDPATPAVLGGVLQAEVDIYAPAVVVPTWVTIATDAGETNVPSQQAFVDLQAKVDAAATKLNELLTALDAAGIVALT